MYTLTGCPSNVLSVTILNTKHIKCNIFANVDNNCNDKKCTCLRMLIVRQKNYNNMFTCYSCAFIHRGNIHNLKFNVLVIYLLKLGKMG